ncbi:hypothetical protein N7486_002629 [Penicillium sp. IBT 16267x]|nr:hypothetical protein N7486_002629 [Penicillium sp. IBT 16267x]
MDFKAQKLFGQDPDIRLLGYGSTHILDNPYKEIYTVTLNDNFQTASGKRFDSYIDGHEHYITPHNTMLVSAVNFTQTNTSHMRRGRPDMWVIDSLFYEIDIKTNQILFKWDALEHIPISKTRLDLKGGNNLTDAWDAYHINSVTPTRHGYLVNFRHIFSAFYINRNGSVRWELSGDSEGGGDFKSLNVNFEWQHDIRVHNESDESLVLSIMNNDAMENQDRGPSTGLVIHVDLVNRKAWRTYELIDPTDSIVSATQGGFQFLQYTEAEHMLLGYGSIPKFKEYDGDGKVFTTDVYMSWNGATDYDNWAILSVPSETSSLQESKLLLIHERTGFETHVNIENINAKSIFAVAREGETILAKSHLVEYSDEQDCFSHNHLLCHRSDIMLVIIIPTAAPD